MSSTPRFPLPLTWAIAPIVSGLALLGNPAPGLSQATPPSSTNTGTNPEAIDLFDGQDGGNFNPYDLFHRFRFMRDVDGFYGKQDESLDNAAANFLQKRQQMLQPSLQVNPGPVDPNLPNPTPFNPNPLNPSQLNPDPVNPNSLNPSEISPGLTLQVNPTP